MRAFYGWLACCLVGLGALLLLGLHLNTRATESRECIPRDQTAAASEFSVWSLARVAGTSNTYLCGGISFAPVTWGNEEVAGIFRVEPEEGQLVACWWEVDPNVIGGANAAICRPLCPQREVEP